MSALYASFPETVAFTNRTNRATDKRAQNTRLDSQCHESNQLNRTKRITKHHQPSTIPTPTYTKTTHNIHTHVKTTHNISSSSHPQELHQIPIPLQPPH